MKHEVTSLATKKTLAESLKKIMEKKSFSKITVSEIISDCGFNRKTFYYHFEDTYQLLKWIFESEGIEVVKHFNLIVDYEEAIAFIMNYIETNDYIINCAYDSIGRDEMKRFFYVDFIELITSFIDSAEKETGLFLSENYKRFICSFYTEALAGMLIDWAKNHKTRNREQVIEYLVKTMKSSLMGILEVTPVTEKPNFTSR
ncbi:MAG: TetR/AcrR family transcriptional regulator C-terminal domain-containing protein [Anaerovoracaceae bacterium]